MKQTARYFDKPRAVAHIKVISKRPLKYQVDEEKGVGVVKPDVAFISLPDNAVIVDSQGNVLEPAGTYYISGETIDPYHLATDVF